jgi:GT2 family glycosyltransferase
MSRDPFVYVIVLNHNGLVHLGECLGSLRATDYGNFRVAIVDNASTDGSRDYVRAKFPKVEIVENKINEQFAGGMNRGIAYARAKGAEYIALLNNDLIVERSWLGEMVRAMRSDPRAGAVAARLMYYQNRRIMNGIGVEVTRLGYAIDRGQGELFAEKYRIPGEVLAFSGGACLLNAKAIAEVGVFDRSFIIYMEDVDLSFRMRGAGWKVLAAPAAVVYHKHSATMKKGSALQYYLILRNRMKLMLKYFPPGQLLGWTLREHAYEQILVALQRVKGRRWRFLSVQIRAHLSAAMSIPSALAFRWRNRGRHGYKSFLACLPKYNPEALPYPLWDYRGPVAGDALPSRIIFGVSDGILGDGWLPLDCERYPQSRWMGDEAECFLGAEPGTPSILQLHVCQPRPFEPPQELVVRLDGDEIGRVRIPHGGWRTLQFSGVPRRETATISFALDRWLPADPPKGRFDLGLRFNEVSLLPEGSPFIRRAL